MLYYQTPSSMISSCPPRFTVRHQRHSKHIPHRHTTYWSTNERSQRKHFYNWSNHRALMLLGGNQGRERHRNRERESGRDWALGRKVLAYPAMFFPGLDPTSSHVSEEAGAQCYPDVRKRGKKYHNIPIIRSAFYIQKHTHSHKHAWQPNNCGNLFTVINVKIICYTFKLLVWGEQGGKWRDRIDI